MAIDVEKLKTTSKSMKDINGSALKCEREPAKGGPSGKYPGPDTNALRTTSKQVSAVSGTVASLKG